MMIQFNIPQDFSDFNNHILIDRLKISSWMLVLTYPLLLIIDVSLLNSTSNQLFTYILSGIHLTGFLSSIIFLMFYRYRNNTVKAHSKLFLLSYFTLFVFLGATASINSQLLTGNIYAYLIIVVATATLFPIQPRIVITALTLIHLYFLAGLALLGEDHFSLLTNVINSTATVVFASIISFTFYNYRKLDFINQTKLKQNEENFQKLFEINPHPLLLTRIKDNSIVLMNKQAVGFYHISDEDQSKLNANFIFKNSEERLSIIYRLQNERKISNYLMEQGTSPDLTRWAMMSFELVNYSNDNCILIGITDVTEFKKTEQELYKHASIDMLTGVLNRRKGLEILQEEINKTNDFIICFIDINNLKQVNDLYGHHTGDELIKTMCEVLKGTINRNDVLFRLGGDEFVIVFFHEDLNVARQTWNEILGRFHNMNKSKDLLYTLSASHGLFRYTPNLDCTLEDLLEFADKEMYNEKLHYKQQHVK